MDRDQLIEHLDQIASLDCSPSRRADLEKAVSYKLLGKDPVFLLTYFKDRLDISPYDQHLPLATAFQAWMNSDFNAAAAWFDASIASGDFTSRNLRDIPTGAPRASFEAVMLEHLLLRSPDAATERFTSMTDEQKLAIFEQHRNRSMNVPLEQKKYLPALAALIRSSFSGEQKNLLIYQAVPDVVLFNPTAYLHLESYLDKIDANTEERDYCLEAFAARCLDGTYGQGYDDEKYLQEIREMLRKAAPDDLEKMTGKSLANLAEKRVVGAMKHAVSLANQILETTGNDEALATLLETVKLEKQDVPIALEAANNVNDIERKAAIINHLQSFQNQ